MDSFHKGPVIQKAFPYHGLIMSELDIISSYYDLLPFWGKPYLYVQITIPDI